jgi:hypothetical protein
MHALGAGSDLAERLRSPQHQFAEDRQFPTAQIQLLRDAMPIFDYAASRPGNRQQQSFVA